MAINKQLELTEYVRRPSTEHGRLYNFTLTGHYTDDEAFVEGVRALVEKLGGEFDFNYAHKANLYRFEIGGCNFETKQAADKFDAAFKKLAAAARK